MNLKNILFSVLLTCLPLTNHAEVITWKGPEGFVSDKYYEVKVNGIKVDVYDTPIASYAAFDFTGKVTVEVITMFDVRWVDIRPGRLGILPTYTTSNSFTFELEEPRKLSVELNGRIRQQPLFIFSSEPEKDIPAKADKNVIWFEGGKVYPDVRLELQDDQQVYIEGGAVVQGYIFAENKKNVRISGRGILDGSFTRAMEIADNKFIRYTFCEGSSVDGIILHNGTTWQLGMFHSKDITINNVKIVSESGGDDGMDILQCQNVVITDVFAHTKDDCLAIKSGRSKYPFNPEVPTDNILVKDCVFWNSIWGNAIEIGFELYSNEVKNIFIENIDVIHVEDGAAMSIHHAGQSEVSNIQFKNIWVEDCRQKLMDVAIFFSQWGPDGIRDEKFIEENYLHGAWDGVQKIPSGKEEYHRGFRGTIRDITFSNIHVTGGLMPFSVFHGFDEEKNIDGVLIENLSYNGKLIDNIAEAKIRSTNTKNLQLLTGSHQK